MHPLKTTIDFNNLGLQGIAYLITKLSIINNLAVRVGFEPTEPVKVQRFSRPPDSTTLAPHRKWLFLV